MNNIPENKDEDLFIDPEDIAALNEALRPVTGKYPLSLPNGKKIQIPFHVVGHAYSLESSRGEKRLKENEKFDPDRDRRIFIKRINRALDEGWKVVDDLSNKQTKPLVEYFRAKEIPVSIINSQDWNTLTECAFPGMFDDGEAVRDRAASINGRLVQGVSCSGDSEPGPD